MKLPTKPLQQTLEHFVALARPRSIRPISQWVEDEIILPTGPYKGERYLHDRHPVSRLWFGAIDSGLYGRFASTAPTQNGKTLMCYVAPVLYHLFEVGEGVVIGLPSMQMANDKWMQDFLPVIEASRFADLLPDKGEGSKGGQVKRGITFRNGATLRFMSAGGGDKKRAGYTTRVLAITETDGMDESGGTSREADKIEQLEGRTRAFEDQARVYLECTVSTEAGRIWQEVKNGTDSRIVRPCPHCGHYVSPDREHLVGWDTAQDEIEAAENAAFCCPECGELWTEAQRWEAAKKAKLLHRGQEITPEGEIVGAAPRTRTFGLRWSAIDNPFAPTSRLGADEWRAARARNKENAEKKQRQFVWAIPYDPPEVELTPLDPEVVQSRVCLSKRGIVPDDAIGIGIGVDTGMHMLHWTAIAVRSNGSLAVIEYGKQSVDSRTLGVARAFDSALGKVHKYFAQGWQSSTGRQWRADQVWIDSGYYLHTDAVYAFCAKVSKGIASGRETYRPSKGYGDRQNRAERYQTPTRRSNDILFVGNRFHIARVRRKGQLVGGVMLVHMDTNYWKSDLHQRLAMTPDEPGSLTLYDSPDPREHFVFANHLTAEKQVEKDRPNGGTVIVWEEVRKQNHFLDATYAATAAAEFIYSQRAEKPVQKGWFAQQKGRR